MGDYLTQYNINIFDNVDNQRNNRYKILNKKKKFIACSYDWKEFYSDDEDNSYNFNLNSNYINKNKLKSSCTLSVNSNSNLKKKHQLKKTNIINKIYDINSDNNNLKNKINKNSNKTVRFQDQNFVKYIDVESYKKYNLVNTSSDSSLNTNNDSIPDNENNNKVDVKCTCLIY